jgi:hypothetical protein
MALAAFVIVTVITGALLTNLFGQSSPGVWFAAALIGVLAAWFVGRLTGGLSVARPRRRSRDYEPEGNYRCPLCAGAGTEPQRSSDRDAPPGPTCRQCGGRGYVDRL